MAETENSKTEKATKWSELNWPKVLLQLHIHIFLTYSLFFLFSIKFLTFFFGKLKFLKKKN